MKDRLSLLLLPLLLVAGHKRPNDGGEKILSNKAPGTGGEQTQPSNKKIYIYDLPSQYNEDLIAANPECASDTNKQVYTAETAIYKQMLAHPSRVRNPEQADLFFVPFLASCYQRTLMLEPYNFSFWRAWEATYDTTLDILDIIKTDYPYWRKSGGKEHIWMFTDDVGGCLAPYEEIASKSILLMHEAESFLSSKAWIEQLLKMNQLRSSTSLADVSDLSVVDTEVEEIPHRALRRYEQPCYESSKDIIIPPRVTIHTVTPSPTRGYLAFFKGTIKVTGGVRYSRGVRQRLFQLYGEPTKPRDEARSVVVMAAEKNHSMGNGQHSEGYLNQMANSTFCLAPRGYASWSPRISESILLDCIPVIIADNMSPPFSQLINYAEFSVTVKEGDLSSLETILQAIPPEQVSKMLSKLLDVRSLFTYETMVPNNAFSAILRLLGAAATEH